MTLDTETIALARSVRIEDEIARAACGNACVTCVTRMCITCVTRSHPPSAKLVVWPTVPAEAVAGPPLRMPSGEPKGPVLRLRSSTVIALAKPMSRFRNRHMENHQRQIGRRQKTLAHKVRADSED
jgi:hypothetical protein